MHKGHVIPRDPKFTSIGDACVTAGGAFCVILEFWFDVHWSDKTKQAIAAKTIHMNMMEFAIAILQRAAVITIMENSQFQEAIAHNFDWGIPSLAKLLIRTDNSPSQNWAHKVSSRSEKGQQMIHLYAALLDHTSIAVACNHVAGKDNTLADFIFRPPTHLPAIYGHAPPTDI